MRWREHRQRCAPCLATVLAAGLTCAVASSQAQIRPLEWTGSLKTIGLRSRASTGEHYTLNLNRVRI